MTTVSKPRAKPSGMVAARYAFTATVDGQPDHVTAGERFDPDHEIVAANPAAFGLTGTRSRAQSHGRSATTQPATPPSAAEPWRLTPLPRALPPWALEIFAGGMLFLLGWILDRVIADLLEQMGVRDGPDFEARWATFFRQTGLATAFRLESFFAATYEEVVFRAYLIARLSLVLRRPAWAVLLAAALFALTHGYPPNSTLTVFVFGVVYGFVYLSSRSIPRLVVAHWIYNLAVMSEYLHK